MRRGGVIFLASCMLCASFAACRKSSEPEAVALPKIRTAPAFTSVNYDGRVVTNRDLDGNVYIAEFFFTSCGGPCPVMNSTASVLQSEFSSSPDFRIVSFTVDPETDTPDRLAHYAVRYGARKDRWYFLRNDLATVAGIASRGFLMGDSTTPTMHSTRFALVDRHGVIRGYYDALDKEKVDELRVAIKSLIGENG